MGISGSVGVESALWSRLRSVGTGGLVVRAGESVLGANSGMSKDVSPAEEFVFRDNSVDVQILFCKKDVDASLTHNA